MPETNETKLAAIQQNDILMEAVALVRDDVVAYEDATAFVTEDVAFHIRSLIRRLRKNYWGIFEAPIDPNTKREKIWPPLTEIAVNDVVKNIDLDQKDVNFRARHPDGIEFTEIIRARAVEEMDKMYFGEKLDSIELSSEIDGTGIWKITKAPRSSKRLADIREVDRLNFYIDPTAPSIQEAYSVVERAIIKPTDVAGMNWDNTDLIKYQKEAPQTDRNNLSRDQGGASGKYAEMYERWGIMPKYMITGNRADSELVEGRILASGIFDSPIVHLIELNKSGLKPYEERWSTKVANRWDGRGAAEKVMMLQIWLNIVINLRINRNTLAQLGVLLTRKGAEITSQKLKRLASTGTLSVTDPEKDVKQLIVSETGQGSYADEKSIDTWVRRVTSTYEGQTGEALPSSTPATNAAIQKGAGDSHHQKSKEQMGIFLQRVFDRHLLPMITDAINEGDLIRLSTEYDRFPDLVDRMAAYYVSEQYDKFVKANVIPTPEETAAAVNIARKKLMSNKDLFIKVFKKIGKDLCDTKVYVTNEEMDMGKLLDSLINMLKIAPEYRDSTVAQIYDALGLPRPSLPKPSAVAPVIPPGTVVPPGAPQPNPAPPASMPPAGMVR